MVIKSVLKGQILGNVMIVITIVVMIIEPIHIVEIITAEEADQEVEIEEVLKMIEALEVMAVMGSKRELQAVLIVNKKVISQKTVVSPDKTFNAIQESHLHVSYVERKDIKKWTAHKDSNIYTELSVI